jgi:TetR/AcrR family transcriptional repressor of nem operon
MSMARPKEFDVDRALDAALEVFWSKGFGATSMQDLVDGMGINRGSLYDTFGSKDELYRRAFGEYAQRRGAELVEALDGPGSVRERLRSYLLGLVTEPDGRGCFIVNTACERSYNDAESRALASTAMDATIGVLEDTMRSAGIDGGLRPGVPPNVAATAVLVVMEGLQVLTKTGADEATLAPVIDVTLDAILT